MGVLSFISSLQANAREKQAQESTDEYRKRMLDIEAGRPAEQFNYQKKLQENEAALQDKAKGADLTRSQMADALKENKLVDARQLELMRQGVSELEALPMARSDVRDISLQPAMSTALNAQNNNLLARGSAPFMPEIGRTRGQLGVQSNMADIAKERGAEALALGGLPRMPMVGQTAADASIASNLAAQQEDLNRKNKAFGKQTTAFDLGKAEDENALATQGFNTKVTKLKGQHLEDTLIPQLRSDAAKSVNAYTVDEAATPGLPGLTVAQQQEALANASAGEKSAKFKGTALDYMDPRKEAANQQDLPGLNLATALMGLNDQSVGGQYLSTPERRAAIYRDPTKAILDFYQRRPTTAVGGVNGPLLTLP